MSKPGSLPLRAGPLRVAIDSPDPLVRASLSALLSGSGSEVELLTSDAPDAVVLWDGGAERDATRERLESLPHGRALVLLADGADAQAALAAGAMGVMLREFDGPRLLAALRAAYHGLCVIDLTIATSLLPTLPQPPQASKAPLTAREREVLQLVADGLSNRRIGARLHVSEHTVKFHVNAILEKLDADSRTQAVVTAVRRGLLWL